MWNKNHGFMNIGARPEISVHALGLIPLIKDLIAKGEGHLCELSERGVVDAEAGIKPFADKIESLGGELFYKLISDVSSDLIYTWEDGMVEIEYTSGNNYFIISGLSQNETVMNELQKFVVEKILPVVMKGHVFAIVYQGQKLSLSSLGDAGIPLNKDNYTPSVIKDYNFIVEDLKSSAPSGRIVILEGSPGTGKTHIIRALLDEVHDAMFVLISPDMVTTISGPELLPLLLSYKQSYATNGPIILILEDADRCLVVRQADNVGSIQALLNLGDGILGSMLDLRIVATTNANKLEMEPAIMRPGRLSKRVEVGPLDLATCRQVFKSLLPEAVVPELLLVEGNRAGQVTKYTLAEMYAMARNHGWKAKDREKKILPNDQLANDDDFDY